MGVEAVKLGNICDLGLLSDATAVAGASHEPAKRRAGEDRMSEADTNNKKGKQPWQKQKPVALKPPN